MLKSKTIDRICSLALVVMLVLTAVVWTGKAAAGRRNTIEVGYEGLFDQSGVHTIDIEIDDWDSFIASATSEEYAACDVTIDGERLNSVGIRAKGNTSLSSVATLGSEKYSFKIEFDHFVDGRLYNGLDKLSLNNLIYDATMMKDYLAYTLMGKMGVPSPLCSYVEITVNGEYWGLYLAVEGVEESFLERNNMTTGELYKPDSLNFGGGRGNGRDFDIEDFREKETDGETSDETDSTQTAEPAASGASSGGFGGFGGFGGQQPGGFSPFNGQSGDNGGAGGFPSMPSGDFTMPSGDFTMPDGFEMPDGFQMPGGAEMPEGSDSAGEGGERGGFSFGGFGGFNFGMGSSDVKLAYIDDDPDSYANIFDSAKTKISKKDKTRLIGALKKLSEGEDIENTVFTDEVIAYLAVHDFLQNSDSYTGMMVHNYYLYEEDGKLAILPWDYNLAFGGMNGSDGTSLVNSPIDSPVATADTSDRPLIAWIFEDEEALARYHEVYGQFVSEIIESRWLEEEISRVAEMIRPYVESDANGFFTAEEFDAAIETLQSYCALRGESIRGQLDGTIPSMTAAQRADSSALIDASGLDVSSMGSMGSGGGFGGGNGGFSKPDSFSFGGSPSSQDAPPDSSAGTIPDGGQQGQGMPGGFDFQGFSGTMPAFEGAGNPQSAGADGKTSDDAAAPTDREGTSGKTPEDTAAATDREDVGSETPEDAAAITDREGAGGDGSRQRGGPGGRSMPEGFDPQSFDPQGFGQSPSVSSGTWLQFGAFVLILLLAIALVSKAPSHNR